MLSSCLILVEYLIAYFLRYHFLLCTVSRAEMKISRRIGTVVLFLMRKVGLQYRVPVFNATEKLCFK
jgi:hypothetical protein